MVYEWKSASRIKANAQEAGKLFEQLEAENDLTAARVVEESRAESAVLHGEFEWNDTKAADKYREHQARNIINAITIKTVATSDDEIPATIRAFFNVSHDGTYSGMVRIASDEEKTAALLTQAKRELDTFKSKYAIIKEALSAVFAAIEEV